MCPNCTDMRCLLLSLLLALGLTVSAQIPDYVPADGLVAWYPFNGNADDESGNGNNGELAGASIAGDHLGGQSAFYFNGDGDQINIPYSASLSPTEQVSVSVWCNPETLEGKNLVSNGTHVNYFQRSYYMFGPNESGQCRFRINAGGVEDNVYSSGSFGTSEWIHVIGTYDGTQMKLYVNGQLEGSLAKSGSINQHGNGTTIGGNIFYAWSDYWFQGSIDDVGIWNRALSEEEVFTLHNAISPITGCTDELACNYNPEANVDDGSCLDCALFEERCGPGTMWDETAQLCVVANPSDTDFDGCVSMTDLLDLLTVFGTCNETPWSCGDPLEYQGYDYETVQIGGQCWFAENARHLPFVSPSNLGWEDDGGAHAYVVGYEGTSVEEAKMEGDYAAFGALYNFAAVEELVMCPQGWHVPSVMEWNVLEAFAGPAPANKLKSAPPVWDGTNELGFNAIRVPVRISSGSFGAFNVKADFWTSTPSETSENNAWGRELNTGQVEFTHDENGKNAGQPVRCIKDSE